MELENNKMINIETLNSYFEYNQIYVPIIQRNYKWPAKTPEKEPEINSAEKLAKDLWISFLDSENVDNQYTVGMITLYPEQSKKLVNRIQLIDGQQRVITLKLLLKVLNMDNSDFKLDFERDEGLNQQNTRKNFLDKHLGKEGNSVIPSYTDILRFTENYNAIHDYLNGQDEFRQKKDSFKNYIFKNVFILFHLITEVEPLDEFLNINKNKTRFTISDYIKAQLLIDTTDGDERTEILKLFESLAKHLFGDKIWEVVSLGYTPKNDDVERNIQLCYPDENRLKVLFSDRYSGNSKLGYQKDNEKKRLENYKRILDSLCLDIDKHNYNQANGFQCYYNVSASKKKYFQLFNKDAELSKRFEEVLFSKINKDSIFVKNCFIQSQLSGDTEFGDIEDLKKEEYQEEWLFTGENMWDDFVEYYGKYVDDKYQKGDE